MPILPISPEELKPLKTVYVCMKRIMGFCGSIKIGVLDWLKSVDLDDFPSLFFALLPITSMGSTGTSIRQAQVPSWFQSSTNLHLLYFYLLSLIDSFILYHLFVCIKKTTVFVC